MKLIARPAGLVIFNARSSYATIFASCSTFDPSASPDGLATRSQYMVDGHWTHATHSNPLIHVVASHHCPALNATHGKAFFQSIK